MPFNFTPGHWQPYTPGSFFLGRDPVTGQDVGIPTEKHLLTVAGARSGKGTSLIIPNLKRWPASVVVIDPGGGNTRATWQDREAMGQKVYVFDPFGETEKPGKFESDAPVPARLRSSFNPLQNLDPADDSYAERVRALADGLVARHDPKHASWDNAACDILAGIIDTVVTYYDPEDRDFRAVRHLMTMPPKIEVPEGADPPDDLLTLFLGMTKPGRHELARSAAGIALPDIAKPNGYISNAVQNTNWLVSPPILRGLAASSFDFRELTQGNCTVYLVLPNARVTAHSRFLRLFISMAIEAFTEGGETNKECLFVLDEFFSLGRLDSISSAFGANAKNGIHLWPFLQNLGQLATLYGREGTEIFLGDADAQIFFGISDPFTLEHVSRRMETLRPDEISEPPPSGMVGPHAGGWGVESEHIKYQHKMRMVGQPRMTPLEVRELVAKPDGWPVARSMVVFGKGGQVFNLHLAPYFIPPPPIREVPLTSSQAVARSLADFFEVRPGLGWMIKHLAAFWLLGFVAIFLGILPGGAKPLIQPVVNSCPLVLVLWVLWPHLPAKPALPQPAIWAAAAVPFAAVTVAAVFKFQDMTSSRGFLRFSAMEAGLPLFVLWLAVGLVFFLIARKWPVAAPEAPEPPRNPVIDDVIRWAKRRRANGG